MNIRFLTCENDVEDAGLALPSHLIGGRAHQRPVVLVVPRRVRQLGPRAVDDDDALIRHADEVGRVVERPLEVEAWRVGRHVAIDVDHFTFTDAVDDGLVALAHGNVCERVKRGEKIKREEVRKVIKIEIGRLVGRTH